MVALEAKREKIVDSYDSVNLTWRRELTLHQPNSFEYAQLEARVRSAYESCQNSIQCLAASERQLRQDLAFIERNFHPLLCSPCESG
jgi:hypothetical protein